MSKNSEADESIVKCSCGCLTILFNIFVGGWSVSYLLAIFLDKTIPFLACCLIGLFSAEVSVPVAIVVWFLKAFKVF